MDSQRPYAGRGLQRERIQSCGFAIPWIACAMLATPAHGAESLVPHWAAVTAGHGDDVTVYGIARTWNLSRAAVDNSRSPREIRIVGQLAYWQGNERPTAHGSLLDISLTPMVRWTIPALGSSRFFAEGGVGGHLLSKTRINNDRVLSTAFQFSEQIGAGVTFGPNDRYEVGLYLQHVSNAGIKEPNPGLTYSGITIRAAFP